MTSPTASEPTVHLSVPASTRYLSAARLVAAALGAESGLSVDDLDDLRLAVDEMVSTLIDGAEAGARIDLAFAPVDGSITVSGSIIGGSGRADADELTRRIIDAVVDHHQLGPASFVLTKSSSLREHI